MELADGRITLKTDMRSVNFQEVRKRHFKVFTLCVLRICPLTVSDECEFDFLRVYLARIWHGEKEKIPTRSN